MNTVLYATLVGALVGALGTGLGAIITFWIKIKGNRISAVLMGFSGGIMLSIVFFDMLPEALEASGWLMLLVWLAVGAFALFAINKLMPHHDVATSDDTQLIHDLNEQRLRRSGLLLAMGIAVHNLPEGLALGSGIVSASSFGMGLAVLLFVHNIPEGMGLAIPLKLGNVKYGKIFMVAILAALPMAIGALVGALIGNISPAFLGGSISFGGGAMLYLTLSELIPQAAAMQKSWSTWAAIAAGVALGGILVAIV